MKKQLLTLLFGVSLILGISDTYSQCPTGCGISATDEQGAYPCDGTVTVSGNFSATYQNNNFSYTIIDSASNLVVDSAYSTQKPYVFIDVCPGTYFFQIYDSLGNICCSTAPCVGTGTIGCSGGGSGGSATVNPYRDIEISFTPMTVCVSSGMVEIQIDQITGTDPPFDLTCSMQMNNLTEYEYGVSDGGSAYFEFYVPLGSACDFTTLYVTDANGYSESFDVSQICYEPPFINTLSTSACSGNCDGTILAWVENWSWQDSWNSQVILYGPSGPINSFIGGAYDTLVFDNLCPGTTYAIDYYDCISLSQPYITVGSSDPTISSSVINGTCDNCLGEATANATGGTGSYNFEWLDSLGTVVSGIQSPNTLCVGDYDVIVTDGNGCKDTNQVTIPMLTISSTTNIISGACSQCIGEATISGSAGSAPYTYEWLDTNNILVSTSGNPTNLCINNYTAVTTDSKGCTDTVSVVISELSTLTNSITSNNNVCSYTCNGSASITTSNAVGSVSYIWEDSQGNFISSSASATTLCPEIYYISTVEGNGCEHIDTLEISTLSNLSISTTSEDESCPLACDASASVAATDGAQPYSYYWTDLIPDTLGYTEDLSNMCPGKYFIQVIDDLGCSETAVVNLLAAASPVINLTPSHPTSTSANDGSISVSSVNAILFNMNGGTFQSNNTFSNLGVGNYTFCIETTDGCQACDSIELVSSAGISSVDSDLSIYPNPASNLLIIENKEKIESIVVYDIAGKIVKSIGSIDELKIDLNISDLNNGVYHIHITDISGKVIMERIVVQK